MMLPKSNCLWHRTASSLARTVITEIIADKGECWQPCAEGFPEVTGCGGPGDFRHAKVDCPIKVGRAGSGRAGTMLVAEAIKRIRWVGSSPPIAD
jgi:hypothetical protein